MAGHSQSRTGRGYIPAEAGCKYGQTDVKRRGGTLDVQNLTSSKLAITDISESISLAPSDGSTVIRKRFVW